MTDIAIAVRNVSKCYRVFDDQRSRLLHAICPGHAKGMQEVWSLKNINFEIKRGEAVGIIGRNGSGKSTLLEIITGTLQPTEGSIQVNGRIAALLELGSGFNPEYTGRENVFLNGLLLGLTRAEVEKRFDDIASFADIGDVLDRPVKTYSSGMLVRLAFAVQVGLNPEILIVDEALSVGDYFFQQKCFGRLRRMREDGLTLLFVSHDMGTVRDLCGTALYLNKGRSVFWGDSKTAIGRYLTEGLVERKLEDCPESIFSYEKIDNHVHELEDLLWRSDVSKGDNTEYSRILGVGVYDKNNNPTTSVRMCDVAVFRVYFRWIEKEKGCISLTIKNRLNQIINNTNTYLLDFECAQYSDALVVGVEFEMNMAIEAGLYSFMVSYGVPVGANRGRKIDSTDWIGPIRVEWDYDNNKAPFLGMFGIPSRGRFLSEKRLRNLVE